MEKLDQEYIHKIIKELQALEIPPKEECMLMWMILREIRDLNFNVQTLLFKLENQDQMIWARLIDI